MIRTIGLTKRYGKVLAVDKLNLHIAAGEIYAFLGPNGAGKTTTISMLLGIVRPSEGEIHIFGERFDPSRIDLRMRIGYVPEKHPHGILPWITSYEYLLLFADLYRIKKPRQRIEDLLEKVGLAEARQRRVHHLSRGMLQKLNIVRALLHDPDLLILDEPISGLDPHGIRQIRDLIMSEKRADRTILISSHQLSEMEKLCSRVAILSGGQLAAQGRIEEFADRMSGDRILSIELDRTPENLCAYIMKDLPFVTNCSIKEKNIELSVPRDADYRMRISEYLMHSGFILVRFEQINSSLEEAFVTITTENVGFLSKIGVQD